jgi:hypothetical protein
MRGTVHWGFVQGGAAVMAQIDGQRQRAARAYASVRQAPVSIAYRVWVDASFAYACAVTGDVTQALEALAPIAPSLPGLPHRSSPTLFGPAVATGACLVLAARGVAEPSVGRCLAACVELLDQVGRRRPTNLLLLHEAGRVALGRSSLAGLEKARAASLAAWSAEPTIAGHPDGCLAAALALRASPRPEMAAAAPAWAADALALIEPRFPPAYAAQVRALLGLGDGR